MSEEEISLYLCRACPNAKKCHEDCEPCEEYLEAKYNGNDVR